MIPILYDSKETAFTTQGIGRLTEAYDVSVKWELNSTYELSFDYPTSGKRFDDITVGRIVWCTPYPGGSPQAFRIYEVSKDISGSMAVSCEHVSYELNNIPVSPYQALTANAALTGIKQQSLCDNPFTLQTNMNVSGDFQFDTPTMARTLLCGSNSIQSVFGGEYKFDNYHVYLMTAIGADNGAILRYGKNITDLKQEENIQDTITGIVPYFKTSDGNLIYLTEKVLYSDNSASFPYTKIGLLDCADMADDSTENYTPTTDALRTYAKQWMADNDIGIPTVSISVSYVDLAEQGLTEIHPGDTVGVLFEKLGVNKKAEVVGYEYDVIAERYNSVTIGEPFPDLAVTLLKQMSGGNSTMQKDMDAIKSTVTTVQNDVNAVQGSAAYLEFGNSGTSTTLSTTATTVQNMNITETDTYNAAAGSLTIKNAGRYMIVANATFQGTGNVHFSMLSGGSAVQTTSTYISGIGTVSASAIVTASDSTVMTFTESCDSGQTIASTGAEKISVQKIA